MTEDDARVTLLVRAWETSAPRHVNWSDEDRAWATRAAAQVEGEQASTDAFVARRARLAAERISKRERKVARALAAVTWRPWIGPALAIVAFAVGAASDAIGEQQRINVLAPPLLAVMAWNVFVYGALALRALAGLFDRRVDRRVDTAAIGGAAGRRLAGPVARLLARAAHMASVPRSDRRKVADAGQGPSPLARFGVDWAAASARLNATRIARMLHIAAIAFALGALAGMYVRGLAFEYRAGWQSTFLDATDLQRLLGLLLAPASWLTGIALPDEARLEAMRFPGSTGEPAGPWIHLYALTVALVVLLPRALLASYDWLMERRLVTHFPIGLDDAYFGALARAHRGEAAQVLVVPHTHQPSPQATLILRELLSSVLGPALHFRIAPVVAYGNEESAAAGLTPDPPPALVVALFAATATPEPETQGRFVATLAATLAPTVPLLVVVDESTFVARFGDDAGPRRRRDERRQAWARLLADGEREPLFVDLERSEPAAASRELRAALDRLSNALPTANPQ